MSYLAQAVTAEVVHLAWRQMAQRHGTPPGRSIQDTGFGVLAYGKLGGLELGYGSDLDLVFVTHAQYEGYTDGAKPIEVQQFYLRLAQRILHLFTTRTVAGVLYEVDLRLRPSGQAGLLVTQLDSFIRYLRDDAWTWELQALVRARPIYGTDAVQADLQDIRCAILSRTRSSKLAGRYSCDAPKDAGTSFKRGHSLRYQARSRRDSGHRVCAQYQMLCA